MPVTARSSPSDGTSTVDDEWQKAALSYAMQNVATVATCAEIAGAYAGLKLPMIWR